MCLKHFWIAVYCGGMAVQARRRGVYDLRVARFGV